MPVYVRYSGWYVYFWTNEKDEPIHFHIAEGKPSENATKIWILSNDSFRLANNNSQVPPKIMCHLLAVMQASLEEYEELWLQYQKNIKVYRRLKMLHQLLHHGRGEVKIRCPFCFF